MISSSACATGIRHTDCPASPAGVLPQGATRRALAGGARCWMCCTSCWRPARRWRQL